MIEELTYFCCWQVFPVFSLTTLASLVGRRIKPSRSATLNFALYLWGAIKKFSTWPSSVQNKIKILFASYSSKAYNTTCTIWLLSYKYFVHFSIWTQCLSDGVENANTKLRTSFWSTSRTIPTWSSKNLFRNSLFRMKRASTLRFWARTRKHAMERTNWSKLSFHYTA